MVKQMPCCRVCGVELEKGKNWKQWKKVGYICHTCLKKKRRKEWQKNREKHLQQDSLRKREKKYGKEALAFLLKWVEDGRPCPKCGHKLTLSHSAPLEHKAIIHHINWNEEDNSPENLVVLCQSCHRKLHGWVPEELRREIFERFLKTPV